MTREIDLLNSQFFNKPAEKKHVCLPTETGEVVLEPERKFTAWN